MKLERVILAGGGTGGHLFPAVSLAEELLARTPAAQVTFVGTARGLEAKVVPQLGHPLELLEVLPLKGKTLGERARGLWALPRALGQARALLGRLRPQVVVGVGGYASGPMVLAARLAGLPTAILEQNSAPGMTNRILGRMVGTVFTAFEEADRHFPAARVQRLGNPLRRRLVEAAASGSRQAGPPADRAPRLLIAGGSQGAHALNQVAMLALETLARRGFALEVRHQTGEADRDTVAQAYARSGVNAEVTAFIERMEDAYGWADAVLCRAGALTLAELCLFGRPALLVPLPSAADDHQRKNARALEAGGAAVVLEPAALDGLSLSEALRGLLGDTERCRRMALASREQARPRAAALIVDALERRAA